MVALHTPPMRPESTVPPELDASPVVFAFTQHCEWMKQRIAIARALANQPEVLLMDEPFGALDSQTLDSQTKEQLQEFFHELWEKTHITVLMITHDIEEAIFLSQRVFGMGRNGKIKSTVHIELPEHRELDMKLTPEFLVYKRDIVHMLR